MNTGQVKTHGLTNWKYIRLRALLRFLVHYANEGEEQLCVEWLYFNTPYPSLMWLLVDLDFEIPPWWDKIKSTSPDAGEIRERRRWCVQMQIRCQEMLGQTSIDFTHSSTNSEMSDN